MTHLAVSELTTLRWSFEEDARWFRESGFDGIAVWRQKLSDYGEEKGAELLTELQLKATTLLWTGAFTGSDGRSFREAVADAFDALHVAHLLGARAVLVHSGGRNGHTCNHARRLLLEGLQAVLPLAEEFNIRLLIEPMPAACAGAWTFLHSLAEGAALVDELETDHVKLVLDTFSFGHLGNLLDEIRRLAPYLGCIHVADADARPCPEGRRRMVGQGHLPLAEIFGTLAAIGFDGDVELEITGEELEGRDYQPILRDQRRRLESLWSAAVAIR